MSNVLNELPHLELMINQSLVENAVNRFLTSTIATHDIEFTIDGLEFLPRVDGDPFNVIHIRFDLCVIGSPFAWVELKLFLDGSNHERVMVDVVGRSSDDSFSLLQEFLDLLNTIAADIPMILELPSEVLDREVTYYLKAHGGNAIIAACYSDIQTGFQEMLFHPHYAGCSSEDRFGFAVNHQVVERTLISQLNGFSSDELRLHNIDGRNIGFDDDEIRVRGGLTTSAPCGPTSVNLDLKYGLTARFENVNGDLNVVLNFGVSFANLKERFLAGFCGIIEAFDSERLPWIFLPLALNFLTIPALFFVDEIANDMADDQLNLGGYAEKGITMWKESERRWAARIKPVAMLGPWGGLLWPMRIKNIDLDASGRVVIAGDQDLDLTTAGEEEANFGGGFEVKGLRTLKVKYFNAGTPNGYDEGKVKLVKEEESLVALLGWELVDDEHRCFTVSEVPSLIPGTGLSMGEDGAPLGAMVMSPQNEIRIDVKFGPEFYRRFETIPDDPDAEPEEYWTSYVPAPGETFSAKLRINYLTKDEGGNWQTLERYLDLNGVIEIIAAGYDPSVTQIHDDLWVMPDDILEIAEEIMADFDFWEDIPRGNDFDVLEAASIQEAVAEVRVTDPEGGIAGRAYDSDFKEVRITSDPELNYRITSYTADGEVGGRFMLQRHLYEHVDTLEFQDKVTAIEYTDNLMTVAAGREVALYDVEDPTSPERLGVTRFRSPVVNLIRTFVDGAPAFIASDGMVARTIGRPEPGGRTVVKQEWRSTKLSGMKAHALKDGQLYGVSASGVQAIGRGTSGPALRSSTGVRAAGRLEASNRLKVKDAHISDRYVILRLGGMLQVKAAPWLGGELIGEVKVPSTGEMKVEGWNVLINDGKGTTNVFSFMKPTKPVKVSEYSETKLNWRRLVRGERAFGISQGGDQVLLYRRRTRAINRLKIINSYKEKETRNRM